MTEQPKTHEFKAEIRQLLDILIHSVYQAKDVFLRELTSNAVDALEKVRFLQVQGRPVHSPDVPLEIRLETKTEGDDKILVMTDTGIGMTAEEAHQNLGTIAHSGATAFLEQLAKQRAEQQGESGDQQNLSLIGRFGVGFYSVFMAAEKVVLTTRTAQPEGQTVVWTSDGLGSYTVETTDEDSPRGTRIEIHLKKEEGRFAEDYLVKNAVEKYSNFVPFPVYLNNEQINRTTAIWREPSSSVSDEQYNEFFKLVSHDDQDPLLRLHVSADAPIQYQALLYVPGSNPESLGFGRGEVSLQLYVKRVLIDGENKNLLPNYLRFVKGVVESDDLPLNVSRETLQENRVVSKIRDQLTKRLLDKLLDMAKADAGQYAKFWETFGRFIKEGYNDFVYREKIADLLRFNSSRLTDKTQVTSLAEYLEKMPAEQTAIYYLTGASREALARDPRLELFRKKEIEVLYLFEAADEFVLANLMKYKDKELISADRVKPADLESLGKKTEEAEKKEETPPAEVGPLVERVKEILGDRILDVRVSERLVDSPACLVGDDKESSGHMDRMMRLFNKDSSVPKRVLELNPRHALVKNLTSLVATDRNDPFVARAAEQLFEGALLLDGYLDDPHAMVERMNEILAEAAAAKATK